MKKLLKNIVGILKSYFLFGLLFFIVIVLVFLISKTKVLFFYKKTVVDFNLFEFLRQYSGYFLYFFFPLSIYWASFCSSYLAIKNLPLDTSFKIVYIIISVLLIDTIMFGSIFMCGIYDGTLMEKLEREFKPVFMKEQAFYQSGRIYSFGGEHYLIRDGKAFSFSKGELKEYSYVIDYVNKQVVIPETGTVLSNMTGKEKKYFFSSFLDTLIKYGNTYIGELYAFLRQSHWLYFVLAFFSPLFVFVVSGILVFEREWGFYNFFAGLLINCANLFLFIGFFHVIHVYVKDRFFPAQYAYFVTSGFYIIVNVLAGWKIFNYVQKRKLEKRI